MLKVLSEFVIRVADLAEAEGRHLRTIVAAVAIGFAFVAVAAMLAVIGAGLLFYAMFEALRDSMGPAPAALVTGLATLMVAGLLGFVGRRSMTSKESEGPRGRGRDGA